ncbi:MAG: 1,6-anhydro-N-acetylmuramyl-L-alanine amidase AmpD [Proteobacteria bacterium]|nr:MAG: 1,6-anhydro-N-acetylmuramyl-L-alanine amidase AmpD [Pseudomonadota bacterium]
MKISKHSGLVSNARFLPSPNCDERPDPNDISLIVIHNISLPPEQFGGEYIDQLFTNCLCESDHPFFAEITHLRVSSHILIRRSGDVVQYVPFHKRAWHAGVSCFRAREVCNDFSIGIELEGSDFEPFCDAQYESLIALIRELQSQYPSLDKQAITGHEHIAPNRKTDPGPFFEWARLSEALGMTLPADAQPDSCC